MCKDCGCGLPGDVRIGGRPEGEVPLSGEPAAIRRTAAGHDRHHEVHEHPHVHEHEHEAANATDPPTGRHLVSIQRSILETNDRLAERNRGYFQAKGLLVLNVLSSPGSGKTTLIQKTAEALRGRLRLGVIVGDLATDNDAARLRTAGVPVVQITTGTVCHLEAAMVSRALGQLPADELDILIIENVGNLVCPASYDLGEHLRVVLLSVTEGEDKPLKYPPLFHSADIALVTKSDLAEVAGFDRNAALTNLRRISHHAQVLEVSARTGAGMQGWCDLLVAKRVALRSGAV